MPASRTGYSTSSAPGGDGISVTDIDLDRAANLVDVARESNAHAGVIRFLAYLGCLDRIGVEHDAVVCHDGANFPENIFQRVEAVVPITQHIDIRGRAYGNIEPQIEQHGAFQKKRVGVFRDG
jgi:hypothetical protein